MADLNFEPWDSLHNIDVCHFEIEREDVFHMKNLYKLVHDWFQIYGWKSVEDNDAEKFETYYRERKIEGNLSEHEIWWRTHLIPYGNNYYKYFLKLDLATLYMGKGELAHKGHKMKVNKGDVIFRVRAWLVLDYKKEWRNHPILKLFDNFFIKRLYKKHIDFLREDLWVKVYNLNDTIKAYLQLKTRQDMPKLFHPELGV